MTQNLHAIISLCFGSNSHSAKFLQDWATHMYKKRLMYTSLQGTNPAFYAKVLCAIDNALQLIGDPLVKPKIDNQLMIMYL
jgi:hypothetical protein